MGFMSMSAVLKQNGHEVEVFFDDQVHTAECMRSLKSFQPQIVGFSILSSSLEWALQLAERVKKEIGAITVFGNVEAILNPELIHEPGVDVVCIGEGEYPLLELASRAARGEPYTDIPSLLVRTESGEVVRNPLASPVDLDKLPFSDRSLYDKFEFFRNTPYVRFSMGRGCPFQCSFCTNNFLKQYYGSSAYVRKMSPERAMAELQHHVAFRKPKYIIFVDEVLWVKNSWLRAFLPLYKDKIGLRFTANFRFGPIEEEDVKLLAECGADTMVLATETGDEAQRNQLLAKKVSDKEIYRIAGLFRKYNIRFGVSAFFGLPGDSVQAHLDQLDFYRHLKATYVWTTFFAPYPGTALRDHPSVKELMPGNRGFEATLHHDMYLSIPDKDRLVNLKKVYFLMVAFPVTEKFLTSLTKYRIPFFFDLLFLSHFTYYAFIFEKLSPRQFLTHVKVFGVTPLLRKMTSMMTRWLRIRKSGD